jgi:outer membrane protein
MKRTIFFFLIIFLSTIHSEANEEIVFIDLQKVFNDSNYGKKMQKKLKKSNDVNTKDLIEDEEKLKKLNDDIKKTKNVISQEELEKKINTLNKQVEIYNKKKNSLSIDFNKLRKKEFAIFLDKISVILSNYMSENSISLILDKKNILIGKENLSITNEILDLVNKSLK